MKYEFKIEDIKPDGFLHSRIYEFIYEHENKFLKINFGFANLKKGGALVDCTITITEWYGLDASLTENDKDLDINKLQDIISENPIDSAIYEYVVDLNTITFNGHVSDYLFSFKFIKPKIHITGEYDPD